MEKMKITVILELDKSGEISEDDIDLFVMGMFKRRDMGLLNGSLHFMPDTGIKLIDISPPTVRQNI
jgi:hypothetical protein